jgi:hypothetical protein
MGPSILYTSGTAGLGIAGGDPLTTNQIFFPSFAFSVNVSIPNRPVGSSLAFWIAGITTQSIANCDVALTSYETSNTGTSNWVLTCVAAISDSTGGGSAKQEIPLTRDFFIVKWVSAVLAV